MVEVFKTNVQDARQSATLVEKLRKHFPKHRISFDLDDCDCVLRMEGDDIAPEKVIEVLTCTGYSCEVLV